MKNKEMFHDEIFDIACGGYSLSVHKDTGKICNCGSISCSVCLFEPLNFKTVHGVQCDNMFCYKNCKSWCESEYVENTVDWSKVPVDTPIFVRNNKWKCWNKRYFSRFEDGMVYAWNNGATSWSAINKDSPWNYAKLAETEGEK